MHSVPLIPDASRGSAWRTALWAGICAGSMLASASGLAQPPTSPPTPLMATKAPASGTDGIQWASLSARQKATLRPLEREWGNIDAPRKGKWLEMARKFPSMSPDEQLRIQTRMEAWAKLSPRERGEARMNFKEAQQVPAQERKARWEAYKALPPDQQKQLATPATTPARKASTPESANAKSNVVPTPSYAARPKAVAPTVAQARPGATTNLITKRASPPAHQQIGMPKIAATSGFVDQSTLLPKRGPQGAAATRSASASTPATSHP